MPKFKLSDELLFGKNMLLTLIFFDVINMIYRIVDYVFINKYGFPTEILITSLISLLLFALLYFGYNWAKWINIIVLSGDGLYSLYFLFFIILPEPTHLDLKNYEIIVWLVAGIFFLIFSMTLLLSKKVNLFLVEQRKKRLSK